jgi:predicted DNA-binding protein
MSRYTKKVQISLTEEQYRELAAIAAHEHKAIGVVVREAVEQTCLAKNKQERIRQAATELLELSKTAEIEPPADYHEWEDEYSRLKWTGDGCNE